MVIPVYEEDHKPRRTRPWVIWVLLGVNVLVLVYLWLLTAEALQIIVFNFGVVSAFITRSISMDDLTLLMPPVLTLVTYSFLHGGWLHLAGNMIFLWVLGDRVEAALGHLRFFLFYLLCGIAGGLAHVASEPSSLVPLIGASGAVAGVVAAYLMLRPWAHITVLLFGIITVRVHAIWLLGVWIAWQVVNVLLLPSTGVSYWSHIGGLIAGAGLVVVLCRRGVKLFQSHVARRTRTAG